MAGPGSSEWWVDRLDKRLDARRPVIERWNDYYVGNHPLPRAPERAKEAFRRWLKLSRSNWLALVVDSVDERCTVQGIRYGADGGADPDAWRMYQFNQLDSGSGQVHLEAFINAVSYVTVAPNPDDPANPFMVPEHPAQMIVECDPAMPRRRLAAWKKWADDTGPRPELHGVLYLPDGIFKVRAPYIEGNTNRPLWAPREVVGEDWPAPNPLGAVPVVPFLNKPRLMGGPRSEIDGVTDTQDRINETLFLRHMAVQYAAFRQRWAAGVPLDVDEETGLPRNPFPDAATNSLFIAESEHARFGEFNQTDLAGYLGAVKDDVTAIAAQTHTPPHYLLGEMVNLSAEALKAAEAGLISKVRRRMVSFGESWEEVWGLAFRAAGDDERADTVDAEVIWRNPEFRTEGETVDALVKMATLGVPREALWERWGASPQEIERWKTMGAQDALFGDLRPVDDEEPPDVDEAA